MLLGIVNRHFLQKFATDIRPLIDVRIQFLFNILRTNRPIETKFLYTLSLTRSTLGLYEGRSESSRKSAIKSHCFYRLQ